MSLSYKGSFLATFRTRDPYVVPERPNGFGPKRDHTSYNSFFGLAPRHALKPVTAKGINRLSPLLRRAGETLNRDFSLGQWAGGHLNEEVKDLGVKMSWEIRVYYYQPHFVQAHLSYSGSQPAPEPEDALDAHAQLLRVLDAKPIQKLLPFVASLGVEMPSEELRRVGKMRRTLSLKLDLPAEDLAQLLHQQRQQLIAMHIARDAGQFVDPRLIGSILESNSGLNLKAEDRRLLVNSQGVTAVAPQGNNGIESSSSGTLSNRYRRASALLEVADLFQNMLLAEGAEAGLKAGAWGGSRDVLKRWIRYPSNVLHASRSDLEIWKVLSNDFSLNQLLDEVEGELE